MSLECRECKCYSCVYVCVCTVCRKSSGSPAAGARLDMSVGGCRDFERLPALDAEALAGGD